jgi:hypothetical protein
MEVFWVFLLLLRFCCILFMWKSVRHSQTSCTWCYRSHRWSEPRLTAVLLAEAVECNSYSSSSHNKFMILLYCFPQYKIFPTTLSPPRGNPLHASPSLGSSICCVQKCMIKGPQHSCIHSFVSAHDPMQRPCFFSSSLPVLCSLHSSLRGTPLASPSHRVPLCWILCHKHQQYSPAAAIPLSNITQ